jgi:ABC-type transport system involved in cytochrome c biogenesis permease subunit
MEIKYTIQGLLIYATIAAYLLALVTTVARQVSTGRALFFAGFVLAVLSYAYRWYDVRHVPLQNIFEILLFSGMICYPISLFCPRVLRIGDRWADMLIGIIVLFPTGFVLEAEPRQLPPALQTLLFAPHVAVYMLSYIFMAKAAIQAGEQLLGKRPASESTLLPPEQATYELVTIGFPLLTLGLILGSWWGKLAWGDYWGWDPKELWSLASWLVYIGYFHWRHMFGKLHPRVNSLWAIAGMAAIIVTLIWVNLSRLFPGLHSYAM